jgi:hypothetical protein
MPVKGSELKVGDDLEFLGKIFRVTDIVEYVHPVVTGGEKWAIAYSRKPTEIKIGPLTWGITIERDGSYEIGDR